MAIENSTIADNEADDDPDSGGGIYQKGLDDDGVGATEDNVTLSSTIVGDNLPDDLGDSASANTFVADLQPDREPGGATVLDVIGSNVIGEDPDLEPLDDNGGPTDTHALDEDSPAVDAGVANSLAVDQRGEPRTVDNPDVDNAPGSDATNIGAVELEEEDGGGRRRPGHGGARGRLDLRRR